MTRSPRGLEVLKVRSKNIPSQAVWNSPASAAEKAQPLEFIISTQEPTAEAGLTQQRDAQQPSPPLVKKEQEPTPPPGIPPAPPLDARGSRISVHSQACHVYCRYLSAPSQEKTLTLELKGKTTIISPASRERDFNENGIRWRGGRGSCYHADVLVAALLGPGAIPARFSALQCN